MNEVVLDSQPKKSRVLAATFLVAGTCIGGGMLALPLMTGLAGFLPSSLMLFVCWVFMASTGLLLLEANLWLGTDKHIISMAQTLLGRFGKWITLLLYLYICYVSLIAYVSAGSDLLLGVLDNTNFMLNKPGACILFGVFFGLFIYLGTSTVGRINSLLVFGMVFSYLGLTAIGLKDIHTAQLTFVNWGSSFLAIPILLTSFSFQTMMPSLTPYLKGHAKSLRWSIIIGTAIPLVAYLLWDCLVLGTVPVEGPDGLKAAMQNSMPITEPLRKVVHTKWVYGLAGFFAFFALVTSFLGISLGLFDFLADGLKIKKRGTNKIWLTCLVFIPTIFFAILFPNIFLVALDSTGGFGDAILNGIIPILMVWKGRYIIKKKEDHQLPGGRSSLLLLFGFAVFVVVIEILLRCNFFNLI